MDRNIEIVPAIKRIEMTHVGCWNELTMEFLPGLNIITEDYPGSGKSTILWAIVRALQPLVRNDYLLTPSVGQPAGDISVDFMYESISLRIANPVNLPLVCAQNESVSHFNLKLLKACVKVAPAGTAILVGEEITTVLDTYAGTEATKLLCTATCQLICIFGHYVDTNPFKQARIFTCRKGTGWGRNREIILRQPGG